MIDRIKFRYYLKTLNLKLERLKTLEANETLLELDVQRLYKKRDTYITLGVGEAVLDGLIGDLNLAIDQANDNAVAAIQTEFEIQEFKNRWQSFFIQYAVGDIGF